MDFLRNLGSRFTPTNVRDAGWTAFGTIVSAIAGLALVKLLATLVRPEAYGRAALLLGVVGLLQSLISGPFLIVHLRRYFDHLASGAANAFRSKAHRTVILVGVLMLLSYGLIGSLFAVLLDDRIYADGVFAAALLIFSQLYSSVYSNYLEAIRAYRRLAFTPTVSRVFILVAAWLLLRFGVARSDLAIVWANAIGALLSLLFLRSRSPRDEAGASASPLLADFKTAAWSLQLGYIANWIMATSDRYFIEYFHNASSVGLYAINYGLWSIPFTMLNGWLETLTRARIYSNAAAHDLRAVKKLIWHRAFVGVLIAIMGCLVLYPTAPYLANLIFGPKYWYGRTLVMSISVAHVFFVAGYSFVSYFLAVDKPSTLKNYTLLAAGVNILLNLLLIPKMHIVGAGLSTLLSYLFWTVLLSTGMERDTLKA